MRCVSLLLALVMIAGCGKSEKEAAKGAASERGEITRIASFSPAITSSLIACGWRERLVGRSPWCRGADDVPVVGSLYEVDLERLAAANPQVIFVQRSASGVPPSLNQAAMERNWRVVQIPATTLAEVRSLEEAIGVEIGEEPAVETLRQRWNAALAPCEMARERSPCVLLYSAQPLQAFGATSYLAEIWQAWGGRVLPARDMDSVLRLEDLFALSPRSVLLVGSPDHALAHACQQQSVVYEVIPYPGLLRPGPELLEALESWRSNGKSVSP